MDEPTRDVLEKLMGDVLYSSPNKLLTVHVEGPGLFS